MNVSVYRKTCLFTPPLDYTCELPAPLHITTLCVRQQLYRKPKIKQGKVSEERYLTSLHGKLTNTVHILRKQQQKPFSNYSKSCHHSSQVPMWHRLRATSASWIEVKHRETEGTFRPFLLFEDKYLYRHCCVKGLLLYCSHRGIMFTFKWYFSIFNAMIQSGWPGKGL